MEMERISLLRLHSQSFPLRYKAPNKTDSQISPYVTNYELHSSFFRNKKFLYSGVVVHYDLRH